MTVALDEVPPTTALGLIATLDKLLAAFAALDVVDVEVEVEALPAKLPCGLEGWELLPQPARQNRPAINVRNESLAFGRLRKATKNLNRQIVNTRSGGLRLFVSQNGERLKEARSTCYP